MHNSLEFQSSSSSSNDYWDEGGEKGMFIVYTFVLRLYDIHRERETRRERERLYTDAKHRNSNDVASFFVPHAPPHHHRLVRLRGCVGK